MAARKEILDFIKLERKPGTPPAQDDVTAHALRIIEIYNERKADYLTLKNDLWELVTSCKICERLGAKHTTFDFENVIMMLLQAATDWQIYLPETELQRYEKVKLNFIDNLADYIRKTYNHQMRDGTPTPAGQDGEAEQELEPHTPPPPLTDLQIGTLPDILDTPNARRIFGKAIDAGYMTKDFNWVGVTERGRNVQLAYLCGKIYGYNYSKKDHRNIGNQFPETELKKLFGINNLQQSLFQFYDRPAAIRQIWLDKLDELFN